MGIPKQPFPNRGPIEYTSISSPVVFGNPIGWIEVISAGSGELVVKDESGTSRTYTGLIAGDIYYGPFSQITSMTLGKIRVGDGQAPPANPAAAIGQISTTLQTSQGTIILPASSWYLATGAPLAIFANGASAVPGSYATTGIFAVRWNDHTSSNAVTRSFQIPPDADVTQNMALHIRGAQIGGAGATTWLVTAYNQVDGALYDADSDYGGTTSAMVSTTKLVQNISLTLALANLAAFPTSVSITIKPTDASMSTDDVLLLDSYVQYTKKLLSS